jgi:hypothetical protein
MMGPLCMNVQLGPSKFVRREAMRKTGLILQKEYVSVAK